MDYHLQVDVTDVVRQIRKRNHVRQRNNNVLPVPEERQMSNLRLSRLLIHVNYPNKFPKVFSHHAQHPQRNQVRYHRFYYNILRHEPLMGCPHARWDQRSSYTRLEEFQTA